MKCAIIFGTEHNLPWRWCRRRLDSQCEFGEIELNAGTNWSNKFLGQSPYGLEYRDRSRLSVFYAFYCCIIILGSCTHRTTTLQMLPVASRSCRMFSFMIKYHFKDIDIHPFASHRFEFGQKIAAMMQHENLAQSKLGFGFMENGMEEVQCGLADENGSTSGMNSKIICSNKKRSILTCWLSNYILNQKIHFLNRKCLFFKSKMSFFKIENVFSNQECLF